MIRLIRTYIDEVKLDQMKRIAGIETDKDLADLTGMSTNTIVRLRKGMKYDSVTLDRLATVLGCAPVDLIVSDGAPPPFSPAPAAELNWSPAL